jgi:hypothetical protein
VTTKHASSAQRPWIFRSVFCFALIDHIIPPPAIGETGLRILCAARGGVILAPRALIVPMARLIANSMRPTSGERDRVTSVDWSRRAESCHDVAIIVDAGRLSELIDPQMTLVPRLTSRVRREAVPAAQWISSDGTRFRDA